MSRMLLVSILFLLAVVGMAFRKTQVSGCACSAGTGQWTVTTQCADPNGGDRAVTDAMTCASPNTIVCNLGGTLTVDRCNDPSVPPVVDACMWVDTTSNMGGYNVASGLVSAQFTPTGSLSCQSPATTGNVRVWFESNWNGMVGVCSGTTHASWIKGFSCVTF